MDFNKKNARPYVLVFEEPAPRVNKFSFHGKEGLAGQIIGTKNMCRQFTSGCLCPSVLWEEENCERFCNGVINTQVRPHYPVAEFRDIGLQCIPREGVKEALAVRRDIPVNPFHGLIGFILFF